MAFRPSLRAAFSSLDSGLTTQATEFSHCWHCPLNSDPCCPPPGFLLLLHQLDRLPHHVTSLPPMRDSCVLLPHLRCLKSMVSYLLYSFSVCFFKVYVCVNLALVVSSWPEVSILHFLTVCGCSCSRTCGALQWPPRVAAETLTTLTLPSFAGSLNDLSSLPSSSAVLNHWLFLPYAWLRVFSLPFLS